MIEDQTTDSPLARLPKELGGRLRKHFSRFLRIEAAGGATLLLATIATILLPSSPWAETFARLWEFRCGIQAGSFEFSRPLVAWINDGLMTLFFFLVALELKRQLVLGELSNPRIAALSVAAALGGMLAPAAIYLSLQWGALALAASVYSAMAGLAFLGWSGSTTGRR